MDISTWYTYKKDVYISINNIVFQNAVLVEKEKVTADKKIKGWEKGIKLPTAFLLWKEVPFCTWLELETELLLWRELPFFSYLDIISGEYLHEYQQTKT